MCFRWLLMGLAVLAGCGKTTADQVQVPALTAEPVQSQVVRAEKTAAENPAADVGPATSRQNADAADAPESTVRPNDGASENPNQDNAPRPAEATDAPAARAREGTAAARTENEPPDIGTRRQGVDWTSFLGPTGDSKSPETGILTDWSGDHLKIVWQKQLGISYGIGAVSRGRYYQFDRIDDPRARRGEPGTALLSCLNAETGDELWRFDYPTDYIDMYGYNGGPRCSPIVDGNRVYIYGAEGMLHCVRADNGKPIWKVDTADRYGVVQNFFGVGSNPVVEGDLLIVMVGGSTEETRRVPPGQLDLVEPNGTAIVAFDKYTGEERYRIGDDLASYASLKTATIDGRRWCFAFCRAGLLAFEPATGKVDFHFPWRAKSLESVNASVPVVVGNEVFISETYGPGSALLRVAPGKYDVVWEDDSSRRGRAMQTHWNTPIEVGGYLYGSSGRNPPDAELRCIEWKSGRVMWNLDNTPTRARTSLLYVDGHFVNLTEYGKLQLLKVNHQRPEIVTELTLPAEDGRIDPFTREPLPLLRYPCWAAPILSHGLLYVRGDDRLVCLELIPAT